MPVATIVNVKGREDLKPGKTGYIKAIQQICAKRSWDSSDLMTYGYKKFKVREVE
jgi:hypothetical protein